MQEAFYPVVSQVAIGMTVLPPEMPKLTSKSIQLFDSGNIKKSAAGSSITATWKTESWMKPGLQYDCEVPEAVPEKWKAK